VDSEVEAEVILRQSRDNVVDCKESVLKVS